MEFNFDSEVIIIAAVIIGVVLILKCILGFIARLVEASMVRKVFNRFCSAVEKLLKMINDD